MSINVNEDVIGSGGWGGSWGGAGGNGLFIFAILIIFIFAIFWSRGHREGEGHAALLPALMAQGGHGAWGHGGHNCGCPPVCNPVEDVAIANIAKEVACTTGQIKTQNAVDTGAIIHALDSQTCEIKLGEAAIIQNQMQIAREQEVMVLTNQIAELREQKMELKGKLLQQETVNSINAGNCQLNHRLDRIECDMAKRPPFYTAGGFPHTQPFNFQQGFDGRRNDCCCGVV